MSEDTPRMARGLGWLAIGLLALPVLLVVTAPELLGADAGALVTLGGTVLLAGVPGIVLVAVVALRRRRGAERRTSHDVED